MTLMTLNKADLTEFLISTYGLNKKLAKAYIEAFFEEITVAIVSEGIVHLSGFGKFVTRIQSRQLGRNLKTGDYVEIGPRKVVNFKAGEKLKELIVDSIDIVTASLDEKLL